MKQRLLLIMILISLSLFITACGGEQIESNMSEEVADFEFVTQDNETFGLEDLEGDWWLANFMYTNCTIVCPTTTPNMAMVQDVLDESNLDAQFVSFSVDPKNDTPEVLKDYAKQYPVDLSNWSFLTGYDFDEIQQLSKDSFQTILEGGGPDEHEFAHSTYFFLVNPDGEIIKKYDGMSSDEMDVIVEDLKTVL
ncbi:SCO family protein [Virgibacillus sp. NKC19-3]|uniref:SCO family protein n=1 Tax=Virgibacillus saliphilus TaxID=2831674 RepID=UPI001C9B8865|nr:SCO family protein [Virgibacillus sp. NKC19-3]MBY7144686.1 SCO family protein [Virgibacillus sp. NKC19-3]